MSTDKQVTARDLAVAEMEYIKSLPYASDHYNYDPALIPSGGSYSVAVQNPPQSLQDGNLQKITVVISKNGVTVFQLEDYKINW